MTIPGPRASTSKRQQPFQGATPSCPVVRHCAGTAVCPQAAAEPRDGGMPGSSSFLLWNPSCRGKRAVLPTLLMLDGESQGLGCSSGSVEVRLAAASGAARWAQHQSPHQTGDSRASAWAPSQGQISPSLLPGQRFLLMSLRQQQIWEKSVSFLLGKVEIQGSPVAMVAADHPQHNIMLSSSASRCATAGEQSDPPRCEHGMAGHTQSPVLSQPPLRSLAVCPYPGPSLAAKIPSMEAAPGGRARL